MSTIMDIKQAASEGTCIAKIARDTGVDRKTVRKYAASYSASMPPFKKSRKSKLTPCEEAIRDHLACTCSTTDAKQRLTAKRIHTMILRGDPKTILGNTSGSVCYTTAPCQVGVVSQMS